jgi:membrane protein DedA with SNARE-associated domain
MPVVRTFVSVPAGVSRMNLGKFTLFTFAGSFPWSVGLAAGGYILGKNWEDIRTWMRPADVPIAIILVILVAWYIKRHISRAWEGPRPSEPEA